MNRKAISLLSGGLDSLLASKVVIDQGIEVVGLHFTSPICNSFRDDAGEGALHAGAELGIRVLVRDKGEEYLDLVRRPAHGYGRNMNPCIDCRIYMLKMTHRIMMEEGASFVITGEVLGQRPMSQRRETIGLIEKESGLDGLILRPLSAKLFPPTLPEREGIIDRKRLFDISGRSRHYQYKMTADYGLKEFAAPAGGCLLTDPVFAHKLKDLFEHDTDFSMKDAALLRVGRHFRIDGRRIVLGRNREENEHLEDFLVPAYSLIRPDGFKGPSAVVKGEPDTQLLSAIGSIIASYARFEGCGEIPVETVANGKSTTCAVERKDINPEALRIKEAP